MAYTIYKELERLLAARGIGMSAKRAAELTHTMYELEYTLPDTATPKQIMLKLSAEQQSLYDTVHR